MATIRRDGTFEYKGVRYRVSQGSDRPWKSGDRSIERIDSDEPGDWTMVADNFGYLSEIRDFIDEAIANDWPDLDQLRSNEEQNYRDHAPSDQVGIPARDERPSPTAIKE
jgi:hypothetical protein